MHTTDSTDRWTEIQSIHKRYRFQYQIMGGVALVGVGMLIGAAIFAQDGGYATNLYTEILSIAITVFIINGLAERREVRRRLMGEAGSQSNEAAKRAITDLRQRGWLSGEDGLLQRTDLRRANLQDARLENANLQRVNLLEANLRDAYLWFANLQGAHLQNADLQDARLTGADLQRAFLHGANLKGANLWEANLQDASLSYVGFDENTILPDSSKWSPDTNMKRFTDPKHPDFWRSDEPDSPAYRGGTAPEN